MRKYIDAEGNIQFLLDGEDIPTGCTELVEKYKRYVAPNGDVHTILADATPGEGWVEEDIDFLGQPDINFTPPYTALRTMNYPQISDQLDMIWHEINSSGSISNTGDWFNSIKDIKDTFPKEG